MLWAIDRKQRNKMDPTKRYNILMSEHLHFLVSATLEVVKRALGFGQAPGIYNKEPYVQLLYPIYFADHVIHFWKKCTSSHEMLKQAHHIARWEVVGGHPGFWNFVSNIARVSHNEILRDMRTRRLIKLPGDKDGGRITVCLRIWLANFLSSDSCLLSFFLTGTSQVQASYAGNCVDMNTSAH